MFELFVLLVLFLVAALAISLVWAVLNVVGHVVGGVFGFLGWLISLPFMILGWILSAVGTLFAAVVSLPILFLVVLLPLLLVALAFGAVLFFALAPVLVVAGVVWLLVKAFTGGRRRTQVA